MTLQEIKAYLKIVTSMEPVTAEQAAKAHLETAIWLWFQQDSEYVPHEPAAIHTLAVAAQGTLRQVAKETQQALSRVAEAMQKEEALRRAQNYYKHGTYTGKPKGKKSVSNMGHMTDLILADNVGTFCRLFGYSTPLLDLFLLWYSWTVPESKVRLVSLEVELAKRIKIEGLALLRPTRFYETLIRLLVEIADQSRPPEIP